MIVFQELKERLTMKDVVELYGFNVNRNGFCSCPFHNEKTPSMKIYEKGFKCFGCGEGGDVIYFVQKYFDLSSLVEASKKLNTDFKLYLDEHATVNNSEYIQMKQRKETLRDKENCALNIVSDYINILNGYKADYKPINENVMPDKRFMEYLSNYENTLELYDSLSNAVSLPFEEKERYYADMEKTIVNVLEKVQAADNAKRHSCYTYDVGQIIGNMTYRAITDKVYIKYANADAPKIAKAFEKSGIKFSGRVYDQLTTFTVNGKDLQRVRDISDWINSKSFEKTPIAQRSTPKVKRSVGMDRDM